AIDAESVHDIPLLTKTERSAKRLRQRDFPAHAIAYYVMALLLYQGVNCQEVFRVVTEGMYMLGDYAIKRDVGKSGISAASTG
ncbi:MAG: transposase domain-containing protein, partial [Rhodocyclaceae bacterium]|nr:transposase domain-containing protein [Rhodocyclaceae bacterium]